MVKFLSEIVDPKYSGKCSRCSAELGAQEAPEGKGEHGWFTSPCIGTLPETQIIDPVTKEISIKPSEPCTETVTFYLV